MDETSTVREVLLRACTGMANGPDIMAQYDAQSAKLATQAEELERLRASIGKCGYCGAETELRVDDHIAQLEKAKADLAYALETIRTGGLLREDLQDQLNKQSAVVEAARWVDSMDHPSPEAKAGLHAALEGLTE